MHDRLLTIEERRKSAGISQERLARSAGVASSYYRKLIKGDHQPSKAVLSRLSMAVGRALRGDEAGNLNVHAIYRLSVVVVCFSKGKNPVEVLKLDPKRRATSDREWQAGADIRQRSLYLAHVLCGVPQKHIAEAAGLTPAAVSLAMNRVEDSRDDVDDDPLIKMLETVIGEV